MDPLHFDDITPISQDVFIDGVLKYQLRETSGDAAVKYENAKMQCYKYQDGKLIQVVNLADIEPLLVSLCLYNLDGTNVSEEIVRSLPDRVMKTLYDNALKISNMHEPEESLEDQLQKLEQKKEKLLQQIEEAKAKKDLAKN